MNLSQPFLEQLFYKDWTTIPENIAVDIIQYDECPTYEQFVEECLIGNRPALFKKTCHLMDKWSCMTEWLNESKTEPNFDKLVENYGQLDVPVTHCSSDAEYGEERKSTMVFSDYVEYWRKNNQNTVLYCKDWHLINEIEKMNKPLFYEWPVYFRSDWLNETCLVDSKDDFRFVYMGPNTTSTKLHMDVLGSYSWSANICGKKRWRFLRPGNEMCLVDRRKIMTNSIDEAKARGIDIYPELDRLNVIEIYQEAGEIIFVPSEWYHEVDNIGNTISINHNWYNGFNILRIWTHLSRIVDQIEIKIADCRSTLDNWYEHCQLILLSNEGMNFGTFYELLYKIGKRRIETLSTQKREELIGNREHCLFDIWIIEKVVQLMLKNSAFLHAFDFDTFKCRPKRFLNEIRTYLQQET
ncbi:unnamed protein product [Didymodactylos carnosus]|uniref:Jumonji domain-containing protein 4 n=1 Tax=Didymodactylos carnosus TaxID=1234261 RepID=A0A813Q9P4_9BILA|nr:unnamed protein product [Didymodactylos carnosus]CAF1159918.1 unnamed protein product [Didymodactylos carnosus]CAF3545148.1 unnamed protein product [Didymodactylos carnosus]CAF3971543.1 unnamed protein product [Didymodactylos carnosus]